MPPGPFAASTWKNYARFRQFFSVLVSWKIAVSQFADSRMTSDKHRQRSERLQVELSPDEVRRVSTAGSGAAAS
jgi:hypothetical protein